MGTSEIFFRIGGCLGGWLIVTGHALILAVLPRVECEPGQLDPWRGTLVMGMLASLALPLLALGRPWAQGIRWIAVPAMLLLLRDALVVWPYLEVGLQGVHPCEVHSGLPMADLADRWQRLWPWVQMLVVVGGLAQAIRLWRASLRLSGA